MHTRTPAGAKPGMAEISRVTVVADVVAVNAHTQMVTLRSLDHTVDLHVPDKTQFSRVKPGDQVRAIYTEAVAVAMEPARKK